MNEQVNEERPKEITEDFLTIEDSVYSEKKVCVPKNFFLVDKNSWKVIAKSGDEVNERQLHDENNKLIPMVAGG